MRARRAAGGGTHPYTHRRATQRNRKKKASVCQRCIVSSTRLLFGGAEDCKQCFFLCLFWGDPSPSLCARRRAPAHSRAAISTSRWLKCAAILSAPGSGRAAAHQRSRNQSAPPLAAIAPSRQQGRWARRGSTGKKKEITVTAAALQRMALLRPLHATLKQVSVCFSRRPSRALKALKACIRTRRQKFSASTLLSCPATRRLRPPANATTNPQRRSPCSPPSHAHQTAA